MNSTLTAYMALICTSGVLNLYLCLYIYLRRHRYKDIATLFVFYTAAIAIYCFAAAFSLTSMTLDQIKFWNTIQYIGLPAFAPLGLLFVMRYIGFKVTVKRCIAFLVIPFTTWIMVATNDWHHLHYRMVEIDPALGAPYYSQEIGPWYVVHGIYMFSCLLAAFLLVISQWKETAGVYRPQLISLMGGQLVPMLTAFLYLVGFTPQGIDPVPMVIWLSSFFYLWSIRSSRLFAIMPIAKDAIFNSMNEGVMVLDESSRLIEFNEACRRNFPKLGQSMYGMDFTKVWLEVAGEPFPLEQGPAASGWELEFANDEFGRVYQVRSSPLSPAKKSKGQLIIFADITELKRLQAELEQQAYYDELTRICNRRAFLRQGGQEYAAAKKPGSPFTVMLMDIDHFKRVNDTYGHQVGDQLLIHVAKTCQTQLNKGQIFARYGGEEFALALSGWTASEAEVLGNQLLWNLEAHPFVTADGDMISVTLSAGIAEAAKETDETLYQLLDKADKALYLAKQRGRNQVCVYREREETAMEEKEVHRRW